MSPELYIQDDLHAWLEHSLHDFIAIRKIKDQTQSMLGGNRKEEMLKKKQRIEKAVEDFEAKSSQKHPLTQHLAATAVRTTPQPQQRSKSTVPPDYQKNAGRHYLHDMVKKAGRRVQAARAGRTISSSILAEDRATPPILRTFLFSASSRDHSSPDSLRTSSKSMAAQDDYRSKPHVSFTSGRLEAALQLPTFPEYCASLNIDMEKGTTNAKILRRAEEAVARLKTLEKRMNEFEKGARKHNAQEMYHRSQRRNYTSIARPAATPVPAHRKAQSLLAGEEKLKFDQECEVTKVGVQRSSDVITRRLEQFEKQQQTQNQRTIDIMDRIQMEKAFILRKKIQLVYSDNEHFKDYGRVIGKFGEIKQSTEQARRVRVESSRQQSHLYEALLEVLRVQEEEPSTTQLQLLESVRRVLEQGWVLQASDYFLVVFM